jgi:hypothetical protein
MSADWYYEVIGSSNPCVTLFPVCETHSSQTCVSTITRKRNANIRLSISRDHIEGGLKAENLLSTKQETMTDLMNGDVISGLRHLFPYQPLQRVCYYAETEISHCSFTLNARMREPIIYLHRACLFILYEFRTVSKL